MEKNVIIINVEFIERTRCVYCETSKLEHIKTLENFPIKMSTTPENSEDIFHNQTWIMCIYCRTIQLQYLVPLHELYSSPHNDSITSSAWKSHNREFASFAVVNEPQKIFEIGGGLGFLANQILDNFKDAEYILLDPLIRQSSERFQRLSGFVEDNFDIVNDSDLIILSHVFEHLYEPRVFFAKISKQMKTDSYLAISIPQIDEYIRLGGANSLNFEHTFYLDDRLVKCIAAEYNLKAIKATKFQKHSYFLLFQKVSSVVSIDQYVSNLSPSMFLKFFEYTEKFVQNLNSQVSSLDKVYLFGAHVFAQLLIYFGLRTENIVGIIDNARIKQGERLYGTNLRVLPPDVIKKEKSVTIIVPPSQYESEMVMQIKSLNESAVIYQVGNFKL